MTPMNVVEVATPAETAAVAIPYSVRLAARQSARASALREEALRQEAAVRERRAHTRRAASELTWLRSARLSHGPDVSLVDLSEGGALLDADIPLKPGTQLVLELDGEGGQLRVRLSILRSHVARLLGQVMIYRGACAFDAPVDLGALLSPAAGTLLREEFAGVDVALQHLLDRVGSTTAASSTGASDVGPMDAGKVLHVLESMQTRMLASQGDGYQRGVSDLLARILPELHRGTSTEVIASIAQERVNRLHTGGKYASFPLAARVRELQNRLAHTAELLKELVQRLSVVSSAEISRPDIPAATDVADPAPALLVPPSGTEASTAWQKIVVRYRDGRLLKGFTQDFHPSRGHFSLWPSIAASRNDRVIVPFSRLKAVFFVRDFNGNAAYVEREAADSQVKGGRRVEVTFVDSEVVRGTTLSYSPDGVGFFVTPSDPRSNNQRIFVVAAALQRVRFP